MEKIIKENLETNAEDHKRAYKLSRLVKHKGNKAISFYLILAVSFFSIGISFIINDVEKNKVLNIPGTTMFLVSLFLFYMNFTQEKRIINHLIKYDLSNERKYSYLMDIYGLKVTSNYSDSFFKWEFFKYYVLENNILLLYTNDYDYRIFVSKNYSKDEWNLLLEWIKLKVKQKNFESNKFNFKP